MILLRDTINLTLYSSCLYNEIAWVWSCQDFQALTSQVAVTNYFTVIKLIYLKLLQISEMNHVILHHLKIIHSQQRYCCEKRQNIVQKKKVAFYTLGCKLNFAETDAISRQFNGEDYEKVDFNEEADVIVVNSCSVTEQANKKCRQVIKKASKNSPNAKVVVVGCYAQLKPEEIADINGVDLVLGTSQKFNINSHLSNVTLNLPKEERKGQIIHSCEIDEVDAYSSSYSLDGRTRSFLKVQDGCDYKCTYCTIPLARGKSRNPKVSEVVSQAKEIAENGVKEIILTGVNIGDFGKSTNETFYDLIVALDKVEGIERFRISSIEPNLLTDEIIQFVSTSQRFVPHFHIPLQSGSDDVLALMKRRYNTELFAKRIRKIKELMLECCIGIDVIVGSPGETDDFFQKAFNFLKNIDFTYLHVFSYSPRENTPALKIEPKVQEQDKQMRSKKMHDLSERKKLLYYQQFVGQEKLALMEAKINNGVMYGFTENYIKVELPYSKELINKIVKVKLQAISPSGNMFAVELD